MVGNKWRIRGSFETEHQPVGIWMKQLIITFKLSRWFKMSCGHVWAAIDLRRNSAKAAATQESPPAYLTFKWLTIAQKVDLRVLPRGYWFITATVWAVGAVSLKIWCNSDIVITGADAQISIWDTSTNSGDENSVSFWSLWKCYLVSTGARVEVDVV